MTSKSLIGQDMLSVNEKKEVIVERNERFIIYKMVVLYLIYSFNIIYIASDQQEWCTEVKQGEYRRCSPKETGLISEEQPADTRVP